MASVNPGVSIAGGRASSSVEVIDSSARQAHATAEADVDIAGAVQITGLRWEAHHRTGQGAAAGASSDVGTVKLLGVELATDSLATLAATAIARSGALTA